MTQLLNNIIFYCFGVAAGIILIFLLKRNKEEIMSEINMGSLYDLNKNLVKEAEKDLSMYKINNEKKKMLKQFFQDHLDKYFMLLCKERADYTLLHFSQSKKENTIDEMTNILVDECLLNRGAIRGIDLANNGTAIEIWLYIDEEAYCYYLFPYSSGVVVV